jgi:hypothetical protein
MRDTARVQFNDGAACIDLRLRTPGFVLGKFLITISCKELDWQLSSIVLLFNAAGTPNTSTTSTALS